jgi:hypothetical protein
MKTKNIPSPQKLLSPSTEIADLLSDITGEINSLSTNRTCSSYIAQLIQTGASEEDAAYIARFCGAIADGEFHTKRSDLKQLLGRNPVSLKDFLHKHIQLIVKMTNVILQLARSFES